MMSPSTKSRIAPMRRFRTFARWRWSCPRQCKPLRPTRCRAEPPFERMIERGKLRIAEQPSDLLERHALIFEVARSEAFPQTVEDLAVGRTFLGEVPHQRSMAHAELAGDHRCLHFAAGKRGEEVVFHHALQFGCGPPLGIWDLEGSHS